MSEFLFMLVGVALGMVIGISITLNVAQKRAVDAGVGQYEINPTNGIITFRYGVGTNK